MPAQRLRTGVALGGAPAQPPPDHFTTGVTLRPEGDADRTFVFDLFAATRAGEFAPLGWTYADLEPLLRSQFHAQSVSVSARHPGAERLIVLADGDPIGRVVLDRQPSRIHLVDIALTPGAQGRGIGRHVIAHLLHDAQTDDLDVTLSVHVDNPARRLYEALGFQSLPGHDPDEQYVPMRWQPPQPSAGHTRTHPKETPHG